MNIYVYIYIFMYLYIYMAYVNTYMKNMYDIQILIYITYNRCKLSKKHQFQFYVYLQQKDGSMITKKLQWLNQKGEILDAYQGQMDSCSFCKHLPPMSGQVVKVVCLIEVIVVN